MSQVFDILIDAGIGVDEAKGRLIEAEGLDTNLMRAKMKESALESIAEARRQLDRAEKQLENELYEREIYKPASTQLFLSESRPDVGSARAYA